jgi:hypothetical protein
VSPGAAVLTGWHDGAFAGTADPRHGEGRNRDLQRTGREREGKHVFKPNLGKTERAVRLVLGVLIAGWVYRRPTPGLAEGLAAMAALFLVLNALLSRCYLWRALGINTCPSGTADED